MADSPFVTRVIIKNYKSIGLCDVALGPLTYLVGANGSGKSNFLDALHFVKDALSRSLDIALRERGGLREVQQRSGAGGRPRHFGISIELLLPGGQTGLYRFEVGSIAGGGYAVQNEYCHISATGSESKPSYYHLRGKSVIDKSFAEFPAHLSDRLALVALSGNPTFRPLYDALCLMGFYNLNPRKMRDPQHPRDGSLLEEDGGNIASVIGHLERNAPKAKKLIEEYLGKVVPSIDSVSKMTVGPLESLEFRQKDSSGKNTLRFSAQNMSDGTLRALGVLTSLFQHETKNLPSLIGIEEPETALHPGASSALRDALARASQSTQVIVTSHSPDLLDAPEIGEEELRSVEFANGESQIAPIDPASRKVILEQLFSAGELLRLNQLSPDPATLEAVRGSQLRLFGEDLPR
jgi:predicted ATPase